MTTAEATPNEWRWRLDELLPDTEEETVSAVFADLADRANRLAALREQLEEHPDSPHLQELDQRLMP